ncbi:MAG: YkgJ family cysteine cluster protein [Promethearchaeia archaeon]
MDCNNCGKCCMNLDAIMLLPSDLSQLKKIDNSFKEKIEKVDGIFYLLPDEEQTCPYFNKKTKKCGIYKWRPKTCRAYPLSYRTPAIPQDPSEGLQINPQTLYLTLCEYFWTLNDQDFKEGAKAIYQMRQEQYNLGILSNSNQPTEKEIKIREFEETLQYEKKEKKFPFDLYLKMMEKNQNLFLIYLKLFDAYFDSLKDQKQEYDAYIKNYVLRLYSEPELLEKAFTELKKRWKQNGKGELEFSFSI